MKKLLLLVTIVACGSWILNTLDYAYATELKNPLYTTRFSGERFIKLSNVALTHIEYEHDGHSLYRVNEALSTIDVATFHRTGADNAADIQYRDQNYSYTLHDGEEKYMVRRKPSR